MTKQKKEISKKQRLDKIRGEDATSQIKEFIQERKKQKETLAETLSKRKQKKVPSYACTCPFCKDELREANYSKSQDSWFCPNCSNTVFKKDLKA